MSAELATVSFRTESGVTEDESWTVVGLAIACATGGQRSGRYLTWPKGSGTVWPLALFQKPWMA
jgi:hypothetical protein